MRRSKLSIGRDAEGADCWRIDTFWAFLGYSVHAPCLEASVSAGIGYLQWYYHTERDEGTTYSPYIPSFMIKAQTVLHFPQAVGRGFAFAITASKEASCTALSPIIAIGG